MELNTSNSTFFVNLLSVDMEADFRVMFSVGDDYIPAVYCSDFYRDEIESNANDGFWKDNIQSTYICPDTTNITFGWNYNEFEITVLPCAIAT